MIIDTINLNKQPVYDKISKGKNFTNYLIVFLSIMTVNPFIAYIKKEYLICFFFLLLFIAIHRHLKLIEQRIGWTLIAIYLIIIIQSVFHGGMSLAIIYIPILLFYIPYLIYKLLGVSFFKYFIKIIFIIALITFPIWVLQTLSREVDLYLRDLVSQAQEWEIGVKSLVFYTPAWDDQMFNASLGIYRNSGLFHEPGAYANILCLCIVINTYLSGKIFDLKNKIFIFCLLTTLSTAGYISFFIIAVSYLWKQRINIILKATIVSLFFAVSIYTYQNEEFLQSKIQSQAEDQSYAVEQNYGKDRSQSGRFFAFFTSVNLFLKSPIVGRGITYASSEKASGEMHAESSYVYGLMGFLKTYGFFFGVFFIYFFYLGFKIIASTSNQPKYLVVLTFIAINLALSTQVFITTTIFILIFIIGLYHKEAKFQIQLSKC